MRSHIPPMVPLYALCNQTTIRRCQSRVCLEAYQYRFTAALSRLSLMLRPTCVRRAVVSHALAHREPHCFRVFADVMTIDLLSLAETSSCYCRVSA